MNHNRPGWIPPRLYTQWERIDPVFMRRGLALQSVLHRAYLERQARKLILNQPGPVVIEVGGVKVEVEETK